MIELSLLVVVRLLMLQTGLLLQVGLKNRFLCKNGWWGPLILVTNVATCLWLLRLSIFSAFTVLAYCLLCGNVSQITFTGRGVMCFDTYFTPPVWTYHLLSQSKIIYKFSAFRLYDPDLMLMLLMASCLVLKKMRPKLSSFAAIEILNYHSQVLKWHHWDIFHVLNLDLSVEIEWTSEVMRY